VVDNLEFTQSQVCFHKGALDVYYTSVFPDEENMSDYSSVSCSSLIEVTQTLKSSPMHTKL